VVQILNKLDILVALRHRILVVLKNLFFNNLKIFRKFGKNLFPENFKIIKKTNFLVPLEFCAAGLQEYLVYFKFEPPVRILALFSQCTSYGS